MTVYIGSDYHWGHVNIMKYCPATRAHFGDVDTMNRKMIEMWNATVTEHDLVYMLGDIAFLPAPKAVSIMRQLRGRKILIEGNHDRKLLRDDGFRGCFEEIHKYLEITHEGTYVVLFHYPISDWDRMGRGSVHFHGHCHGNPSGLGDCRALDVGYDARGTIVSRLDDMVKLASKGEIRGHH